MTTAVRETGITQEPSTGTLAQALAERLEKGAQALATLASGLTESQWQARIPHDGRPIGVVVHHVGTMYPLEIQLAQAMAAGQAIEGVFWDNVHEINAKHATEYAGVTKEAAIDLLNRNAPPRRRPSGRSPNEQLSTAVPVSLYGDAPLTCQFMLEDHAVRHSYHHLAKIKTALKG